MDTGALQREQYHGGLGGNQIRRLRTAYGSTRRGNEVTVLCLFLLWVLFLSSFLTQQPCDRVILLVFFLVLPYTFHRFLSAFVI
ncbi:hypothetical protein BJ742DRAFT_816421 [Cladochytrium replicatum]|nr:hypothetical protein BJ742DRAFT_816421 [Cladochytrium replicatum]